MIITRLKHFRKLFRFNSTTDRFAAREISQLSVPCDAENKKLKNSLVNPIVRHVNLKWVISVNDINDGALVIELFYFTSNDA